MLITRDGLNWSTMNDIMEPHDQFQEINYQTSWFTSYIVFIVSWIIFVIHIAFLSCIFQYLYAIRNSLAINLKLNNHKALFTFINNCLQNLNLNQHLNNLK
jgi:hypothetical protein